ncbi:MAG: uracil-DNA glycosylase [Nevskia sp.]|nr:uracil-DNA glycosylase [Nevskia sp.]
MDSTRRKHYLDALGIEPWLQRTPAPAQSAVEPAAPAQESAPIVRTSPVISQSPALFRKFPERNDPAPSAPAPAAAEPVPTDWDGLKPAVAGCIKCKLCQTRTNTVFGVGQQSAPLMVVGEGPGADEDAQGEPFVGRAGKLLDEMLRAIGRSRQEQAPEQAVYIANVVKCRPPGNRDPEADEVEACRPYLDQQIRLVRPRLIVALGRIAAQRLLSTDAPLSKLRGPMYEYGPERTPLLITYHPAYLLRSPGEKAKSWADLKRVHQFLAGRQ